MSATPSVRLYAPDGTLYAEAPPREQYASRGRTKRTLIGGACSRLPWVYGGDDSIARRIERDDDSSVAIVDYPWFSTNSEDLRNFTWEGARRQIRSEIVDLVEPGKRMQLIGYSLGCFAAIELAYDGNFGVNGMHLHHPDERLVLINPPFVFNDPGARLIYAMRNWLGQFKGPPSDEPVRHSYVLEALLRLRYLSSHLPSGVEYARRISRMNPLEVEREIKGPLWYQSWPIRAVVQYLQAVPQIRRKLKALKLPITIVTSELDVLVEPNLDFAAMLSDEARPLLRHVRFENVGHFSPMYQRSAMVDTILRQ